MRARPQKPDIRQGAQGGYVGSDVADHDESPVRQQRGGIRQQTNIDPVRDAAVETRDPAVVGQVQGARCRPPEEVHVGAVRQQQCAAGGKPLGERLAGGNDQIGPIDQCALHRHDRFVVDAGQ